MKEANDSAYYLSHKLEILSQFETHSQAWKPLLIKSYGDTFTNLVINETRRQYELFIPKIPYIGGDKNPMTRHLIRSTTSLIFYLVMKSHGKTAEETGKIIYDAVQESVKHLPLQPGKEMSPEFMAQEQELARKSQERQFPGNWLWYFVKGDGIEFDYGYNYLECSTQKLYQAHHAEEFLPYYCYLDFVTARTPGWGVIRTETLSEGYSRCNSRVKKGWVTQKGWPPPFTINKSAPEHA